MKPTGFVEVKSSEALPRLQAMYDHVEVLRFKVFAVAVNNLLTKKLGWFGKRMTPQQAWDRIVNDDYGYLLEPGCQQEKIKGLIIACSLSETVLINTDELETVLYGQ